MRTFRRSVVLMSIAAMALAASSAGAAIPLAKTVQVPTAPGAGVSGPDPTSGGEANYTTLYGDARGTTLLKINADGGAIERQRWFDEPWVLPAVTIRGEAGGLSADGRTLVLFRPDYSARAKETEFQVLNAPGLRTRERFELEGTFGFDAISPDGERVYLVEYLDPRNPFDYAVRAFDVGPGRLLPGEIVDPSEPDERMAGQPVSRRMSPDGRWAYTLYAGGEEAFIHALDTEGQTAVCVDLHGFTPDEAYSLRLAVNPGSGAITVSRRGLPVASVDPVSFQVQEVTADPVPTGSSSTADAGGDWLGTAAIAAGIALFAAALTLLVRRHRRATA